MITKLQMYCKVSWSVNSENSCDAVMTKLRGLLLIRPLYSVSENFVPLKFLNYFSIAENFKAIFYMQIWNSSLRQSAKFYSIILKFDEVMLYYACSENFSFSEHIYHKTQSFDISFDIWQQTIGKYRNCWDITATKTAKNIFLKKFISDIQNVRHQLKHMHSDDTAKVCHKSTHICCSAPFSYRMVFSFKLSL